MSLITNKIHFYIKYDKIILGDNMKIKSIYKESEKTRKERINNSIKTYTKVIKPKKGKSSYDRRKGYIDEFK